jgi:hypothetical protein
MSVIPITSQESWDVTNQTLSGWEYFWNLQDILESSSPDPGKTPLRQKYWNPMLPPSSPARNPGCHILNSSWPESSGIQNWIPGQEKLTLLR